MKPEKLHIKIEWSPSALWGSTDPEGEGYDAAQSEAKWQESLTAYVYDAYPDAEVEIIQGINDRVTVDGMTDHDEVPWINQIVEVCWNGDDWLIFAS